MTDRPILFSAPMVKALLAGTKTQTRRILRYQPVPAREAYSLVAPAIPLHSNDWVWPIRPGFTIVSNRPGAPADYMAAHVLIKPGDRLWVREGYAIGGVWADVQPGKIKERLGDPMHTIGELFHYRADADAYDESVQGWRPGMHMPRWASRITLHVTDVRVQRLQEISTLDAKDEGIPEFWDQANRLGLPDAAADNGHVWDNRTTVENYRALWEHINGPESWDANPWVTPTTFTVERCNIDQARKP